MYHIVSDMASGKAGCDSGGLYLALNLRLTPVQMWDLLGRCHALKLSSGSHSPSDYSGFIEIHYTLDQRKRSPGQSQWFLPSPRGGAREMSPRGRTALRMRSGLRLHLHSCPQGSGKDVFLAHPGQARRATKFSLMATLWLIDLPVRAV